MYTLKGVLYRGGKSRFPVHMGRHAGYGYYNSFVNAKEWHSALRYNLVSAQIAGFIMLTCLKSLKISKPEFQ